MHTCGTWLLLYATPTHLPSICPFTHLYVLISALSNPMYLPPALWAWIRAPATHFLGARILITSTTSTPPAALSALPQHLPPPFSVIVLSSQYLFQRGPIWMTLVSQESWHDLRWVSDAFLRPNSSGVLGPFSRREWTGKRTNFRVFRLVICPFPLLSLCFLLLFFVVFYCLYIPLSFTFIPRFLCCNIGIYCCDVCSIFHCFCCHGIFVSFIASL